MNNTLRIYIVALALLLGACTTSTTREYEACLVGSGAAGGIIGGAGSGGVGGIVVGAGVGTLICKPAESEVQPERYEAEPVDTDGDGVNDADDRCPGTPGGAEVDMQGCALDSDGDGVKDYADDCPGTPAGVVVDDAGCPVKDEVVLTIDRLGFAYDSAELNGRARSALDAAVDVIKSHSSVQMDVVGYADSRGTDEYNIKLSQRRAQAAVDYLVSKGVSAGQLRAVGRGEADPVASNDNDDGRARNRRVELIVR